MGIKLALSVTDGSKLGPEPLNLGGEGTRISRRLRIFGERKKACILSFELSNAATSVGEVRRTQTGQMYTYFSKFSNSSRLRCLERKAAARFLTRRASRLLRPVTSGCTKSLEETCARAFLAGAGAGLAERLWFCLGGGGGDASWKSCWVGAQASGWASWGEMRALRAREGWRGEGGKSWRGEGRSVSKARAGMGDSGGESRGASCASSWLRLRAMATNSIKTI